MSKLFEISSPIKQKRKLYHVGLCKTILFTMKRKNIGYYLGDLYMVKIYKKQAYSIWI